MKIGESRSSCPFSDIIPHPGSEAGREGGQGVGSIMMIQPEFNNSGGGIFRIFVQSTMTHSWSMAKRGNAHSGRLDHAVREAASRVLIVFARQAGL